MRLGDFLKRELSNAAPWNCSTAPFDWCIARGHPDFLAPWRHISEPVECEAIAVGGLVLLWDLAIGGALPIVFQLQAGDIGVVSAKGLEAGAIWTGSRWAIRTARGWHFVARDAVAMLKAWRP